jgi:hypothetical protein
VSGEGRPGALGIELHLGADRTTGARRLDRDIGQRHRLERARVGAGRIGFAIPPIDRLGADIPEDRGAAFQLLDDFFGRLNRRHAGRKRDAAAAGHMGEPD